MPLEFTGTIWYWKGPAPFYFVTIPAEISSDIKAISKFVTYGWGMIPVAVIPVKFQPMYPTIGLWQCFR